MFINKQQVCTNLLKSGDELIPNLVFEHFHSLPPEIKNVICIIMKCVLVKYNLGGNTSKNILLFPIYLIG